MWLHQQVHEHRFICTALCLVLGRAGNPGSVPLCHQKTTARLERVGLVRKTCNSGEEESVQEQRPYESQTAGEAVTRAEGAGLQMKGTLGMGLEGCTRDGNEGGRPGK